ncbi:radical SAM superfamily enzyme YgiQ (UPF0313 family) [Natranaerovirga hydrolytica]|uniref:Radical SAM superfamily enzyme YgiQ (UPF0313 family) n=1 Tax=Natranaerovirga hydrolytica TaxID=680378 RepID=A0A4R1MBX7_9FIRM|nr:B12-binding domain-containing radical SAM protein [Natranaerovirga hydrolytica]TCK89020.1 radical SAM superfamily enzyme YgiQ (UPF0313 family) [Natranaerovirga hydrolytica]
MKVLLTAINAKYIHTNLALYSLKAYSKEYEANIHLKEFTINNKTDHILREIYKEQPDVIALSCYIWNVEVIRALLIELNKIMPKVDIWLGGPEVSFDAKVQLEQYSHIKGIMCGEGEGIFKDVVRHYIKKDIPLKDIKGLVYRDNHTIIATGNRVAMNMNDIPFPYDNIIDQFENKIIYYESARGCPFSCQYCLSSAEKNLRFKDIAKVKEELKKFILAKVKQVKFVDRTFNCKKEHALKIWQFLNENDNGITNFHFEISADLMDEETLEFLKTIRPGLFQFEIGVQSTNEDTLQVIQRKTNFDALKKVVKRVNDFQNIHQHLDLIAGLPKEDYTTFQKSFNEVYALEPEQLQLGFLKVLKGTGIDARKDELGIVHRDQTPYEVLYTKELMYDDLLRLKNIEEMVEMYYNSSQFLATLKYLETKFETPFQLYESLGTYYEKNQLDLLQHSRITKYKILLDYYTETIDKDAELFTYLMIFDLYVQENLKNRPKWAQEKEDYKERIKAFYKSDDNIDKHLSSYKGYNSKQIMRMTHIENFPFDIVEFINSKDYTIKRETTFVLFDYNKRDPLTHHGYYQKVML